MSENKSRTGDSNKVQGGQRARLDESQRSQKGQTGEPLRVNTQDDPPPPPPPPGNES